MSGILDLLGLSAANSGPNAEGSDEAQSFQDRFTEAFGSLGEQMRPLACWGADGERDRIEGRRQQLHDAYHKVLQRFSGGGDTAPQDAERVISATEKLNEETVQLVGEAEQNHRRWSERDEAFNTTVAKVAELEDAGHAKAATLRKLVDSIRGRVEGRRFGEAADAFDQAAPKIDQLHQEAVASRPSQRTVPGAGGYTYEQHADGRIFIVGSPQGERRIPLKGGSKAYEAVLAEIGPFPEQPEQPLEQPTGSGDASSYLDGLLAMGEEAVRQAVEAGEFLQDAASSAIDAALGGASDLADSAADFFGFNGDEPTNEQSQQEEGADAPEGEADPAGALEEALLDPATKISQSVGKGGKNQAEDVLLVQQLLKKFGHQLTLNGEADEALNRAIGGFQSSYAGIAKPDQRIDPGGKTWNTLIGIGRIKGELADLCKKYGLEPAVILAIQAVESGGNGFLPDGRPKILFEGHKFWQQLQKVGIDPAEHLAGNSDVLYKKWDRTKYVGGPGEYRRLEKAQKIHHLAALKSASWGEFQIMGFNHQVAGYPDVESFVESMQGPGSNQLRAVLKFMESKNIFRHVSGETKDWDSFCFVYNGEKYKEHGYHTRLAEAYARFAKL